MRTIFAEYNPQRNSIDVYTSAGYMLRIDCWEAEKDLKTTPRSVCSLNALAIDEPLEYAKLYLDGTMQIWVDAETLFIYNVKSLNFSGIIFGLYLLFNLTDNDSHMRFIFRNHIINHASLHLIPIYIP